MDKNIKMELELEIKLLEYLKNTEVIDNNMYYFCINKILHKLSLVKQ